MAVLATVLVVEWLDYQNHDVMLLSQQSDTEVLPDSSVEHDNLAPVAGGMTESTSRDSAWLPGTPLRDRRSNLARELEETQDYHAFVNEHSAAALGGDGEASYLIHRAIEICAVALAQSIDDNGRLLDEIETLVRWSNLPSSEADYVRANYRKCSGFFEDARDDPQSVVMRMTEDHQSWIKLAVTQGDLAAVIYTLARTTDSWVGGPEEDESISRIVAVINAGHPRALFEGLSLFSYTDAMGIVLLACENGFPCSAEDEPLGRPCRLEIMNCLPGESYAELVKRNLPPSTYDQAVSAYWLYRSGSQEAIALRIKAEIQARHQSNGY